MDINQAIIIGEIKEIIKTQTLKNGLRYCWLNVSTDISLKSKGGIMIHNYESHRVVVYGKYADVIMEKANIGQKIYIKGRLKTNKWEFNNISFEKTFIVLEIFKLYKIKNPENYKQQEEEAYNHNVEEELKFSDYPDSGFMDDWDDDKDDRVVLSMEEGWYYEDENDTSLDFFYGIDASLDGSKAMGWEDLDLEKSKEDE